MASLTLNDLPNEILRMILSDLSPMDILPGWWNINTRFNDIILSLTFKTRLEGKTVTQDKLSAILFFQRQVSSLSVTKRWCPSIEKFINLEALQIKGFVYPFSSLKISANSLPRLKFLDFMSDHFDWDKFMGAHSGYYALQMIHCHCSKLIHVPHIICPTLGSVKFSSCSSEALAALLRLSPNLHYLAIGILEPIDINLRGASLISISRTTVQNQHLPFLAPPTNCFEGCCYPNIKRVELQFACETTLKWLDSFLLCTPNVTHFQLRIPRSYEEFSFVELHRILNVRLVRLIPRNFQFQFNCLPKSFNIEQHRSIGPLFKTMIAYQAKSGPMMLLYVSVNWSKHNEDDF